MSSVETSSLVADVAAWRRSVGADVARGFLRVDPERAGPTPFGGPGVHGYRGLSSLAPATQRLYFTDAATGVSCGRDKVRVPSPLSVAGERRCAAELVEVAGVKDGLEYRIRAMIEPGGSECPPWWPSP